MVSQQSASLDGVFHALADPTRRAMLRALTSGERNIGELAAPFNMSFAAASKHIRVLESAGLLRRRVQGRRHVCRIEPSPLAAADKWLRFYEHFWNKRLDALEALLKAEDAADAAGHQGKKKSSSRFVREPRSPSPRRPAAANPILSKGNYDDC